MKALFETRPSLFPDQCFYVLVRDVTLDDVEVIDNQEEPSFLRGFGSIHILETTAAVRLKPEVIDTLPTVIVKQMQTRANYITFSRLTPEEVWERAFSVKAQPRVSRTLRCKKQACFDRARDYMMKELEMLPTYPALPAAVREMTANLKSAELVVAEDLKRQHERILNENTGKLDALDEDNGYYFDEIRKLNKQIQELKERRAAQADTIRENRVAAFMAHLEEYEKEQGPLPFALSERLRTLLENPASLSVRFTF